MSHKGAMPHKESHKNKKNDAQTWRHFYLLLVNIRLKALA